MYAPSSLNNCLIKNICLKIANRCDTNDELMNIYYIYIPICFF